MEKGRVEYYGYRNKFCVAKWFKVTPQRIAIYDALRGHHDHPTAEMLYHTLRPEHPSMSLATVIQDDGDFGKNRSCKILEVGDERVITIGDTSSFPYPLHLL